MSSHGRGNEDGTPEIHGGVQAQGGGRGDAGRRDGSGDRAARHGINPNQLSRWKTEAYDGPLEVFGDGGGGSAARDTEKLIERLYARIGELVVERDFFRGVPGSRTVGEGPADPRGREPAAVAQVRAGGREPVVAVLPAQAGGRGDAGAAAGGGQALHGVPVLRHAPGDAASPAGRPRGGARTGLGA